VERKIIINNSNTNDQFTVVSCGNWTMFLDVTKLNTYHLSVEWPCRLNVINNIIFFIIIHFGRSKWHASNMVAYTTYVFRGVMLLFCWSLLQVTVQRKIQFLIYHYKVLMW
jgi:hypothetical protein